MEKPSKRELAALLQALIILSGYRPTHQKEKQAVIESVCQKYNYSPEITEITADNPIDIFSSITEKYTRLQFANLLISMIGIGQNDFLEEIQLSYFSKLLTALYPQ